VARRSVSADEIAKFVRELSPVDRARLIERMTAEFERDSRQGSGSSRSLLGLWSDLGAAPSDLDMQSARGEAWQSFPRDLP
jgi:hypothetical protein